MKRLLALLLVLGAAGVAVTGYVAVKQERRFRQLVADGDAALARDDTFVAIEAYTGAITLKHLDARVSAAGRDLPAAGRWRRRAARPPEAAELDPSATRPREMLGDLLYAQGRYDSAAEQFAASVQLDDASPRVQYKLALSRGIAGPDR